MTWKQVVTAAKVVRDVLKTLGLESWVKTTGGRGLHVVVPIKPARDWSECLEFARDVSEAIERTDPIYTTTFAKAGRERKILIDFMRNNRTNTSVSAFSPRARPGAMVSMPLEWRELSGGPERWTLLTVPERLKRLKTDPWAGYWTRHTAPVERCNVRPTPALNLGSSVIRRPSETLGTANRHRITERHSLARSAHRPARTKG